MQMGMNMYRCIGIYAYLFSVCMQTHVHGCTSVCGRCINNVSLYMFCKDLICHKGYIYVIDVINHYHSSHSVHLCILLVGLQWDDCIYIIIRTEYMALWHGSRGRAWLPVTPRTIQIPTMHLHRHTRAPQHSISATCRACSGH